MGFKDFKQFADGHIHLDVSRIVGIGDCFEQGRVRIWMEGRREPFEVEGDVETLKREIENARARDGAPPIVARPPNGQDG